jgi:predicted transcriptional regulator
MSTSNFTIRLEDDLRDAFCSFAKQRGRSASELIRELMKSCIGYKEDWIETAVKARLYELQHGGKVLSGEEVERELLAWEAETDRLIAEQEKNR